MFRSRRSHNNPSGLYLRPFACSAISKLHFVILLRRQSLWKRCSSSAFLQIDSLVCRMQPFSVGSVSSTRSLPGLSRPLSGSERAPFFKTLAHQWQGMLPEWVFVLNVIAIAFPSAMSLPFSAKSRVGPSQESTTTPALVKPCRIITHIVEHQLVHPWSMDQHGPWSICQAPWTMYGPLIMNHGP